jgi:hypothetical protein
MPKIVPMLYHGTTSENAEMLLRSGWQPNQGHIGSNRGNPRYLYLSTDPVDASFYGYSNDEYDHVVLAVKDVPLAALSTDPEDSQRTNVEEEVSDAANFPGRLVLTHPLSARHFSRA